MVTEPESLAHEEYPGELRELRAICRSIAQQGCLECQLRASLAALRSRHSAPPRLRLVTNEGK